MKIEREEDNEVVTSELKQDETNGDPLNLVFNYCDSRFQGIQNQIKKKKEPVAKNPKSR